MTSQFSEVRADLRTLSGARGGASEHARLSAGSVARPASRWRTRILVPAAVILSTGGVLAYAARDAFQARTPVWVAAVVPKNSGSVAAAEPDHAGHGDGAKGGDGAAAKVGAELVQAPGWVEPSPFAITVPALADGVVREVLVLEGDRVAAGQVVARLVDDDSRLQVRAAQAALAQRQADTERARAALATTEAQIRVEQAAVTELADEISRKRDLVAIGGVSAGEFRRMEIRLGALEGRVIGAERARDEARSAVVQMEAGVEAARVPVEEAELRLARMEIRAPADGMVMARLVEPGSRISMSSTSGDAGPMSGTVLRTYDPARMQVRVDVPLADAGKVGIGTSCTITSEALPDAVFQGRVIRAVHEANIQRNTVQFKVLIENPSAVLKPEMLARVKLHAAGMERGDGAGASGQAGNESGIKLLVPTGALTKTEKDGATAWVVEMDGSSAIARRREVRWREASDEGYAVVVSGLRLTDRVILEPPATLRDGARVTVLGERAPSGPAAK